MTLNELRETEDINVEAKDKARIGKVIKLIICKFWISGAMVDLTCTKHIHLIQSLDF